MVKKKQYNEGSLLFYYLFGLVGKWPEIKRKTVIVVIVIHDFELVKTSRMFGTSKKGKAI